MKNWEESKWRVGRKLGRTIYRQSGSEPSDGDVFLGIMDFPEWAKMVVEEHNHNLYGDQMIENRVLMLERNIEEEIIALWSDLADARKGSMGFEWVFGRIKTLTMNLGRSINEEEVPDSMIDFFREVEGGLLQE